MPDKDLPPTPIYHYTSQRGLIEIIKTKKLWATNLQYLNDSEELNDALNLTIDYINKHYSIDGIKDSDMHVSRRIFREQITAFITEIRQQSIFGIYVSSFSANKDLLSQWRGYCPSGNGYSIGFSFDIDKISDQCININRCVYKIDEKQEILKEILFNLFDVYRRIPKSDLHLKNDYINPAVEKAFRATNFMEKMFSIAPLMKNENFFEEQEWRLVSWPLRSTSKKIQYREGKSTIIPYIEIDLSYDDTMPIKNIIIGPTPNPELSKSAVEGLLRRYEIHSPNASKDKFPEVIISSIPYRSW